MAVIRQPRIAFTSSAEDRAKVSFQVDFDPSELGALFPAFVYSAQVFFNVTRIVPQPFVVGSPPPPRPDPVPLDTVTLSVPRPPTGHISSLAREFTYTFAVNSILITDHLQAKIRLRRRLRALPDVNFLNIVLDTKTTNDAVLSLGDLASPQPNGAIIP